MPWTRSAKNTWTCTRHLLATMCVEMCLEVYPALSMHCPCAGHDVLGDVLTSVPEMALYHILCFRARAFAHAPLVPLTRPLLHCTAPSGLRPIKHGYKPYGIKHGDKPYVMKASKASKLRPLR